MPNSVGGIARKFRRFDVRVGMLEPHFRGYKSAIIGRLEDPRGYHQVDSQATDREFSTFGRSQNAADAAPDLLRGSTPLPKESDIVLKGD